MQAAMQPGKLVRLQVHTQGLPVPGILYLHSPMPHLGLHASLRIHGISICVTRGKERISYFKQQELLRGRHDLLVCIGWFQ